MEYDDIRVINIRCKRVFKVKTGKIIFKLNLFNMGDSISVCCKSIMYMV